MGLINIFVEGEIDEAVARKIIIATGHTPGTVYGKYGSDYIRKRVNGFNNAAAYVAYLTLVDFMDTGLMCPPEVVASWLPHRNQRMIFRVVEREIESWLLADRQNIANFMKVSLDKIPQYPETLKDPKQSLISIARGSKSSKVRSAIVPRQGSIAQVGKLYTSEIINFINTMWNIESARVIAPSLDKCLIALEAM